MALPSVFGGDHGIDRPEPEQAGFSALWQTAEAGAVESGQAELGIFVKIDGLGRAWRPRPRSKLWVRTDGSDDGVARVRSRWGFVYAEGEGWSRDIGFR